MFNLHQARRLEQQQSDLQHHQHQNDPHRPSATRQRNQLASKYYDRVESWMNSPAQNNTLATPLDQLHTARSLATATASSRSLSLSLSSPSSSSSLPHPLSSSSSLLPPQLSTTRSFAEIISTNTELFRQRRPDLEVQKQPLSSRKYESEKERIERRRKEEEEEKERTIVPPPSYLDPPSSFGIPNLRTRNKSLELSFPSVPHPHRQPDYESYAVLDSNRTHLLASAERYVDPVLRFDYRGGGGRKEKRNGGGRGSQTERGRGRGGFEYGEWNSNTTLDNSNGRNSWQNYQLQQYLEHQKQQHLLQSQQLPSSHSHSSSFSPSLSSHSSFPSSSPFSSSSYLPSSLSTLRTQSPYRDPDIRITHLRTENRRGEEEERREKRFSSIVPRDRRVEKEEKEEKAKEKEREEREKKQYWKTIESFEMMRNGGLGVGIKFDQERRNQALTQEALQQAQYNGNGYGLHLYSQSDLVNGDVMRSGSTSGSHVRLPTLNLSGLQQNGSRSSDQSDNNALSF